MIFNEFTELCSDCHNPVLERFYHSETPVPIYSWSCSDPKPSGTKDRLSIYKTAFLWTIHVNKLMQYVVIIV